MPFTHVLTLVASNLARSVEAWLHGSMHLTHALEFGEHRIYATRHASVVSYFTAAEDGDGVELHVEPGWIAGPYDMARNGELVREAALQEVAQRLGVDTHAVCLACFQDLMKLLDPELPEHYRYAKRTKNRSYPR